MSRFAAVNWIFLRMLGVVHVVAFGSLWVQLDGLIGSRGILPAADFFERLRELEASPWQYPSLVWLSASDVALHGFCALGVALALALVFGLWPRVAIAGLWATYLSMTVAGQRFLSFQWDSLLIETTFLSLFLAPGAWVPRRYWSPVEPPRIGVWLLRLLLFKLMFLSGAVKLVVLDETWWNRTALDFHYFTQPIPSWTSWYAHALPAALQRLSVTIMFVIELVLPFFVFFTRSFRGVAFFGLLALQGLIAATGNYGFFNLLTAVLCLWALDDRLLESWTPRSWRHLWSLTDGPAAPRREWLSFRALSAAVVFAALLFANGTIFANELVRTHPADRPEEGLGPWFARVERHWLDWAMPLLRPVHPIHSVNGYGLFRSMTTRRPELIVEGSRDGESWEAYEFRFKPGRVDRAPGFCSPHMPRLDWQLWFAALSPRREGYWLERFIGRLLQASPPVLALLEHDPFRGERPEAVRISIYEYEFTNRGDESPAWWERRRLGFLTRPLTLDDISPEN